MLFADPRAVAVRSVGDHDNEYHLVDAEGRTLASAIGYGDDLGRWWGVCSHRSGIPIDRRAKSSQGAQSILKTTVWTTCLGQDRDEFSSCSEDAIEGLLFIRSLADEEVLEAARDDESPAYARIWRHMGRETNPSWITSQCAETAYLRGVMDAQEMDGITR